MQKFKLILVLMVLFIFPVICWAAQLDALKVDFLQGNYRRGVFDGQAELERRKTGKSDEMDYILGLMYLKKFKFDIVENWFWRIFNNFASKIYREANLSLADTYLVCGNFQPAEDLYNKLISDDPSSRQKPAVWYRLSQLEAKRGNHQKSNDYLLQLKRDFPLYPELRVTKGISWMSAPVIVCDPLVSTQPGSGEYYVQVGFFSSSLNAHNFKNKLLSKNYPAYVENSGSGYRVKVGRCQSQQEALDLESKLSQDGFATKICPL
jgi:tetratricopeptide (TPR) repeat protein